MRWFLVCLFYKWANWNILSLSDLDIQTSSDETRTRIGTQSLHLDYDCHAGGATVESFVYVVTVLLYNYNYDDVQVKCECASNRLN